MFYLTTHSTHFIYGYMASDIWLRTILIVRKETRCRHIGCSFRLTARVLLYAPSHRQDSTAFVTPVVEHWLEQEIAQWVYPMKDRSDDPSHHERCSFVVTGIHQDIGFTSQTTIWIKGNFTSVSKSVHVGGYVHVQNKRALAKEKKDRNTNILINDILNTLRFNDLCIWLKARDNQESCYHH